MKGWYAGLLGGLLPILLLDAHSVSVVHQPLGEELQELSQDSWS